MKRFLFFTSFIVALLSSLIILSCSSDSSSSDEKEAVTLTERLASAKDGDVIDFSKENIVVDKDVYTISKSLSIKNAALDGVTIKVDGSAMSGTSRAAASASADIIVLFEKLTGLKFLDIISAGNVEVSSSSVENVVVSSNDTNVSVTKVTVEKLTVVADGVVMNVSSAKVTSMAIESDASISFKEETTVTQLKVKDDFTGYISKTENSVVTEATTESGETYDDIIEVPDSISDTEVILNKEISGGIIREATYWNTVLSSYPIVKWLNPDAEGVFTAQYYQTDDMWNTWNSSVWIECKQKKGKNYKIRYKLKTSTDSVVHPHWTVSTGERNMISVKTKAGEWSDVTLYTSKLLADEDEIEITNPIESYYGDVELQLKDFSIEETTDAEAPVYATENWAGGRDLGSSYIDDLVESSCDSEGVVSVTIKKKFDKRFPEAGVNVQMALLNRDYIGKLVEISYEIMVENETNLLGVASDINWNENVLPYSWGWGSYWYIPANEWLTVKSYIPVSKNLELDVDPAIKIWISDGIENTIKVRNAKIELCEDAPCDLYWENPTPYAAVLIDSENGIEGVKIPANTKMRADINLSYKDTGNSWNWRVDNILYTSTEFMNFDLDSLPAGIEISAYGSSGNFYIENTTASDIYLKLNYDKAIGRLTFESVLKNSINLARYVEFDDSMPNILSIDDEKYPLDYIDNKAEWIFAYDSSNTSIYYDEDSYIEALEIKINSKTFEGKEFENAGKVVSDLYLNGSIKHDICQSYILRMFELEKGKNYSLGIELNTTSNSLIFTLKEVQPSSEETAKGASENPIEN